MGRFVSAGCLGVLLVVGLLVTAAFVMTGGGRTLVMLPSPTPLPRLSGGATDDFALAAGEAVAVRRLTIDVPASALPIELGEPVPVHVEIDVTPSDEVPLSIAVVDGTGADVVRQRLTPGGADVRWEAECPLREACHRTFDVAFSREDADADLDIGWRVKGQLRYRDGGLVPADAALALSVAPGPEVDAPKQPVLAAELEPQTVQLSAAEPFAIRVAVIQLRDADGLPRSALGGLRGFVRTELLTVPEATPRPADSNAVNLPAREPPPIEVTLWTGDAEPAVTRTIATVASPETDQVDLAACDRRGDTCEIELIVLLRLLSDRSSGTYEVELGMDAQLLAEADVAESGAELTIAERSMPQLVVASEATARHQVTLTRDERFTGQARLSAVLNPAPLLDELDQLPTLSSIELSALATVDGSTRRPLLRVVVPAGYADPPSVRDFRPGETPMMRRMGFGDCSGRGRCHDGFGLTVNVEDHAEEMTSAETVTVELEAKVTVLGFAADAVGGGLVVDFE